MLSSSEVFMITRRQLLGAAGLVGITAGVSGCSEPTTDYLEGTPSPVVLEVDQVPETLRAVDVTTSIAWSVLTAHPDVLSRNAIISPSSLAVTLAMLGEGATGTSAESLDGAFEMVGERRSKAIGALKQSVLPYAGLPSKLNSDDPPESPMVHQANRLVVLDDADVHQDFLDRIATFYGTGVAQVPQSQAAEELNTWFEEQTTRLADDTKIKITDETRLITQDTILLAARWKKGFERDDVELPFTTGDGSRVTVPAMQGTVDALLLVGASETDGDLFTTIRLPYDDGLAMDITLPTEGIHPSELLFALEIPPGGGREEDEMQTVNVTLPASDVASSWELLKPLEAQGIDLSEMDGVFDNATAGQMAQQVQLSVTARGTSGGAVVQAELETKVPELDVMDFTVDRPYLMCVRDTRTQWPLFIAVVNDPTSGM